VEQGPAGQAEFTEWRPPRAAKDCVGGMEKEVKETPHRETHAYEGRLTTYDTVQGHQYSAAQGQPVTGSGGNHSLGYVDAQAIGQAPLDSRYAGPHIPNTGLQSAACRRCGKSFVRPPNAPLGATYFRCQECNSTGAYIASMCPIM